MLLNGENNAICTHHYLDLLLVSYAIDLHHAHIRTKVSCRPATDRSLFREGSHRRTVPRRNWKSKKYLADFCLDNKILNVIDIWTKNLTNDIKESKKF